MNWTLFFLDKICCVRTFLREQIFILILEITLFSFSILFFFSFWISRNASINFPERIFFFAICLKSGQIEDFFWLNMRQHIPDMFPPCFLTNCLVKNSISLAQPFTECLTTRNNIQLSSAGKNKLVLISHLIGRISVFHFLFPSASLTYVLSDR